MLQPTHLAIVRAALTYWDEEMSGADQTVYQHYLHSQDANVKIDAVSVTQARQFFNAAKLRAPETLGVTLPKGAVVLTSETDQRRHI